MRVRLHPKNTLEPLEVVMRLVCLFSLILCLHCFPVLAAAPSDTADNPASAAPGESADAAEKTSDLLEDAWIPALENQLQYAANMEAALEDLRKTLPEMGKNISLRLPGFDTNARSLELLSGQYADNPQALQAVGKRYALLQREMARTLENAERAHSYLNELQPKLAKFEESLSGFQNTVDKSRAQEVGALLRRAGALKKKSQDMQNRLSGILAPADFLKQRTTLAGEKIGEGMAERWLDYYSASGRFLTLGAWENLDADLRAQRESLQLRLPVELPLTVRAWTSTAQRFLNTFLFGGLFLFLLYAHLRRRGAGTEYRHMFTGSLPWICLGIAFYGTTFGTREESYRALLTLGTFALTWGQLSLAWDLRRVNFPNSPRFSPLRSIFPLLILGSLLILFDLPASLQGMIWIAGLLLSLFFKRRRPIPESLPRLEAGILKLAPLVLWLAVFITLFGWARIAVLLNLFFVTQVVGVNLAVACTGTLHRFSTRIPEEGIGSLLGGLFFGCAFPLVLALVLAGMLQCLVSCPGGAYLVLPYLRSSINLGGITIDIVLILFIFGAFYLIRALSSAGKSLIRKLPESGLDPTLITPLQAGFTYGLWMLFVLVTLRVLGVDTDKLAIVAGGLSVGLGFGMQAIVNNLVSGLILIFSRALREGDVVEVGNLIGTVRKISVRATTVETFDNAVIFVPNSEFISTRLINWTRNSRTVRREITVGVAYGTDHKLVLELLLGVAASNARVLKYPKPAAFFTGFGASTLDFSLRFWVNDYNDGLAVASELRGEIAELFAQRNVEIAFPQLDVHMRNA